MEKGLVDLLDIGSLELVGEPDTTISIGYLNGEPILEVVTKTVERVKLTREQGVLLQKLGESYEDVTCSIDLFIEDRCSLEFDGIGRANELWLAYNQWGKYNHIECYDRNTFGQELGVRFEKKRTSSGYVYIGIKLN